jgi:lysophospholipase L1-like esterase
MSKRNPLLALATAGALLAHPARAGGTAQVVLCVGDSITESKSSWVGLVRKPGEIETINAGKGGRVTAAAAETFERARTTPPPFNRVVFFLGVNDLPARNPLPAEKKVALCVENLGRALDLALKTLPPKDVVLVAPCGVDPETMRQPHPSDPTMTARRERNLKKGYDICQPILEQLEVAYQELAKAKGVPFVSLLRVVSKENLPDGLHPNEAGQRQIAEVLGPFLAGTWQPVPPAAPPPPP